MCRKRASFWARVSSTDTYASMSPDSNFNIRNLAIFMLNCKQLGPTVQFNSQGWIMADRQHIYANVLAQKPKSYWDYRKFNIQFGNRDDYQLVKKIGKGKYGEVFEAINVTNNEKCAIKVLKPIRYGYQTHFHQYHIEDIVPSHSFAYHEC